MQTVVTENGEMNIGVDWLSISIPVCSILSSVRSDNDLKRVLLPRDRKMFNLISEASDLKEGAGRAPFKKSWHSKERGFTYFESHNLPYSLVEFTGVGCDVLRQYGWMNTVIHEWSNRLTRMDIACDIATDVNPITFMRGRDETKFKSESNVISETGITCYIGSKTSDRYTRVYRYNPPHPRADFLRIEFVLKSDYAKQAAKVFVDTPLQSVAKGMFEAFGWKDFSHLIKDNGVALTTAPKENHQGKTERWLLTQVLPALQRLSDSGNVEFISLFQKRIAEIQSGD